MDEGKRKLGLCAVFLDQAELFHGYGYVTTCCSLSSSTDLEVVFLFWFGFMRTKTFSKTNLGKIINSCTCGHSLDSTDVNVLERFRKKVLRNTQQKKIYLENPTFKYRNLSQKRVTLSGSNGEGAPIICATF